MIKQKDARPSVYKTVVTDICPCALPCHEYPDCKSKQYLEKISEQARITPPALGERFLSLTKNGTDE